MANGDDLLLTVRDLKVVYTSRKKTVHAVNGVSFHVRRGETLALVGETGAGKTTIAKSILRILPHPPARVLGGEILLGDTDLLKCSEREMLEIRGARVAMVFQDPMSALNPLMSVGDQIAESILLHKRCSEAQALKEAKELLETVGIPGQRASEYPFQFSGGMKQRVVIAMALACNPQLLLADEPTTALDVTIQAQVLELISELKAKYGAAMILITHDLGVVAQTCDRVAVVYAGQIVEYGSKKDIFVNCAHPYTHGLFASLPSMSQDSHRLKPIPGSPPDPTALPQGCVFHPRCSFATEDCKSRPVPLREIAPGHFCRCWNITQEG